MPKFRYSRRQVLQSLGASAALLPLLSVDRAPAQSAAGPKRLVTVSWCNGLVPPDFYPEGSEVTIGETLRALEPWKDKLTIIEGLDLKVMSDYPDRKWDGHFTYPTLLTGTADPGFEVARALGPSIDHFIAAELQKKVALPFPSLYLGVNTYGPGTSWRGEGQANTPETSAQRLFERLFSSPSVPAETVNTALLTRRSILDYLGSDLEAFGRHMGTDDRARLEAHLTSVRELEQRIAQELGGTTSTAGCLPPTLATGNDTQAAMRNMFDLVAAALKCDATRVVAIDLYSDVGADGDAFPWVDVPRDYHTVAHDGAAAYDEKLRIDGWIFSQIANLVEQLDASVEGERTTLDNTVILTANDMEEGESHSVEHIPFALIGSCGGYLKTGQALHYRGEPHNKLLATLCNAMDVPVEQYGESYSGVLSDLIA